MILRAPSYAQLLAEISSTPQSILEPHLFAWLGAAREFLSTHPEASAVEVDASEERITPIRRAGAAAVIPVIGRLEARAGSVWEWYGMATSYERLGSRIRQAVADTSVDVVVLDINSPGGEAMGMQELSDQIRALREEKRIVAVANPLAASAAYGLGVAASQFFAVPSAMVGSVGTILVHMDWSKALEEQGIKPTVVRYGEAKGDANPYEPLTEESRARLQQVVDTLGASFVKAVAAGRGVTAGVVKERFGRGAAVMAADALERGMVDKIATLEEVLARGGRSSKQGTRIGADEGGTPPAEQEALDAISRLSAAVARATGGTR